MASLLIRCVGPTQSWGSSSKFDLRGTNPEPTKSGIVGLLACALGRERPEPVADLAALKMGVRVDREGVPREDFHTITGVRQSNRGFRKEPIITRRQILDDAAFLVALEGPETLLQQLAAAIQCPKGYLWLGRKTHLPSQPILAGIVDQDLKTALLTYPSLGRGPLKRCRFVFETAPFRGQARQDVPQNFELRLFGTRWIENKILDVDLPREVF